jgi:hypothetical protein
VGEKYYEALEELRFLANEIRSRASESTYGFFHGGDPRDFYPDPEASTEEERNNHRIACEAYSPGKPDSNPFPAPHCTLGGIKRVASPGFGLGMNHYEDEDMVDWSDRLYRAIARLESE